MSVKTIKALFLVAALYDVILGLVFLFFYPVIYAALRYPLPENPVYLQGNAVFVILFGIAFYLVYRDPLPNRGIVLVGILMKIAFAGVVFGHRLLGEMPGIFLPMAAADLVFAALFVLAYGAMNPDRASAEVARLGAIQR